MIAPEIAAPILGTAIWYLLSSATIAKRLHALYPPWLAEWATCAACCGTWTTALIVYLCGWPMLGYQGRSFFVVVIAGFWGMVLVPPIGWLLIRALSTMWTPPPDLEGTHVDQA